MSGIDPHADPGVTAVPTPPTKMPDKPPEFAGPHTVEHHDWKRDVIPQAEHPPPGAPPPKIEAPENVDIPYLSQSGGVLSCTMGNWTAEPTSYAYQWVLDGMTNVGGNTSQYVVTAPDVGHSMICVVTAINASGSTIGPPSNSVVMTTTATQGVTNAAAGTGHHLDPQHGPGEHGA